MIHGTRPTKKDYRDYDFHKTFGATLVPNLPTELLLDAHLWLPNQNAYESIFGNAPQPYGCTNYTSNDLCANQDTMLYNPAFTESITHANTQGGYDVRQSLLTTIKYGTKALDGTINKRTQLFNVQKYAMLDYFDSIRYAMLPTLGEKRTVSWGTPWYLEWEQDAVKGIAIMKAPSSYSVKGVSWHNSEFIGWTVKDGITYLVNKSWQGQYIGDKGFLYFPREVVNAIMDINGTCAFTVSKIGSGQPVQTISTTFFEWIYSILDNIFTTKPIPPQPMTDASVVLQTPEVLLFDTPQNAYHSVRVLCDNAGLTVTEKNLICACIYQESAFKNTARCENKNKQGIVTSVDNGLCQVNSYYHTGVGKEFPSTDYVIAHPEEAVKWMINMYQSGLLKLWVSYSSGAYLKWLKPTSPMWKLKI